MTPDIASPEPVPIGPDETAIDHTRDVIDCGPGHDVVHADKIDAVKNCEVVLHH